MSFEKLSDLKDRANHREVLQLVKEFKIWLFHQFYVHILCKRLYRHAMMSAEGIFRPNVENKVYHAAGGSPRKWQGNLHLSWRMKTTCSSLGAKGLNFTCTQLLECRSQGKLCYNCEILWETRNSTLRYHCLGSRDQPEKISRQQKRDLAPAILSGLCLFTSHDIEFSADCDLLYRWTVEKASCKGYFFILRFWVPCIEINP